MDKDCDDGSDEKRCRAPLTKLEDVVLRLFFPPTKAADGGQLNLAVNPKSPTYIVPDVSTRDSHSYSEEANILKEGGVDENVVKLASALKNPGNTQVPESVKARAKLRFIAQPPCPWDLETTFRGIPPALAQAGMGFNFLKGEVLERAVLDMWWYDGLCIPTIYNVSTIQVPLK